MDGSRMLPVSQASCAFDSRFCEGSGLGFSVGVLGFLTAPKPGALYRLV